eukprot:5406020-Prymnesium_polylepis.1
MNPRSSWEIHVNVRNLKHGEIGQLLAYFREPTGLHASDFGSEAQRVPTQRCAASTRCSPAAVG